MAEWNYNNQLSYSLNVSSGFQPNSSLRANQFNDPFNMNTSAHQNLLCGTNQSQFLNSEWFQFGNNLTPVRLNSQHILNTSELSWGMSRNVDQYVSKSMLSEPQQNWLNMNNQRKADQYFLDNFVKSRITPRSSSPTSPITKMNELRGLMNEAQKLRDRLSEIDSAGEAIPKESLKIEEIKERLEFIMEQIDAHTSSKEMHEKILKRRRKREWIKRKKERQQRVAKEAWLKREELNRLIDEQREIVRQKELNKKKEEEARRQADIFLGDVRRKQGENKRLQQMLHSLKELRRLRARSLESRCALFSTEEDSNRFINVIDKLILVTEKQATQYEEEEETLRTSIEVYQSKRKNEVIKKRWRQYATSKTEDK